MKDMIRDDLINRFPTYTFTEETRGDLVKLTVKDDQDEVVQETSWEMELLDIYRDIRVYLLGPGYSLCLSTAAQRALWTGVTKGVQTMDDSDDSILTFNGSSWV